MKKCSLLCYSVASFLCYGLLLVNAFKKWLEPFQAEAARAAAQAQAIAAEKATEAAQNVRQIMEQSPPRMRLDVELAAPTIVVPQKSTSLDALVFDLGTLLFFHFQSERVCRVCG